MCNMYGFFHSNIGYANALHCYVTRVLSCRRQSGSGAHLSCYVMGTGVCSRGYCGRGVPCTHIHLVPRSRMGGAVPLLLHRPSYLVHGELYLLVALKMA
jgi:hypothetical protein